MRTQAERDAEHQRLLHDVITEERSPSQPRGGPLIFLAGAILVLLLVLWLLPADVFPPKAQLGRIPGYEDIVPGTLTIPTRPSSANINDYVLADDPDVKLVASRVVTSACSEPDKKCYADALFHFTQASIGYVSDPIAEYYELPQETLLARSADCDGQAILLSSLLRSVGVLTRFNYDTPNHVAVEAWVPQRSLFSKNDYAFAWYYLDPTCKQCRPGERQARP